MIKSSVFFVQLHAAQVVSATETELTFHLLGMHFVPDHVGFLKDWCSEKGYKSLVIKHVQIEII